MANRILRDDPGKGDMHNRQALSWEAVKAALSDYHLWPMYLLGLSWNLPQNPMQNYITLNLTGIGFGTFETNLLTIPAFVLFIIGTLVSLVLHHSCSTYLCMLLMISQFWTFLSEHINERMLLVTASQLWVIPCLAAMLALPASRSHWATYTLSILIFGMPYIHAILTALTSRNAGSVRTRTVASAVYNMTVQAAGLIGSNVSH